MTPQEVVKFAQDNDCKMVDYKFLDFVGIWQHFATPINQLSEDTFEEGIGFDGSSIRGCTATGTPCTSTAGPPTTWAGETGASTS